MRIGMTVQEGGASREVLVEAPAGSTARELAAALGAGFSGTGLCVDGRPVSVTSPLGMPPLLDGAVVSAGPVGAGRPGGAGGARGAAGADTSPRPAAHGLGSGWELWVVSGPATGDRLVLGPRTHLVGRAANVSLCLDDPDVSRRHLELTLGVGGVALRDLGSANGTQLDGIPVGTSGARAADGSVIAIGSSRLELHRSVRRSARSGPSAPSAHPALAHPDGAGHLLLDPRPPQPARARPEPLPYPEPPPPPTRSRFPLVALFVPLALAGAIAALMHSPTMLLFGLSGPVLSLAAWWGQRRAGRSRRAATEHLDAVRLAELTLAGAAAAERLDLIADHPPPSAVLRDCEERSARLWNGEMEVRVGLGPRTASARFVGEETPGPPELEDAPLTWKPVGHLGVVGPRPLTARAAANVLGRASAHRSPHTLRVCVVTGSPADWQWVAMLPHARDGDENRSLATLLAEIDVRANVPEGVLRGQVLALVDLCGMRPGTARAGGGEGLVGAGGRVRAGGAAELTSVISRGAAVGVHLVVLAVDRQALPPGLDSVLAIESPTRAVWETPAGQVTLTPDLPSARWAERLARALCPLRDATPGSSSASVPDEVRLLDLVCPAGELDARELVRHWTSHPRSTSVVLGATTAGPLEVELTRDGPHALVAGTTGSGKSELLRTLVAGLALRNRPDEMVFVLVDYKGGATFRDCAGLPHVVGLVTDLDEHLTRRALVSLGAEVRRRERLLAAAGVADLPAYQRLGLAPLPRLVLVVDEFRVLAEELPDFVSGLVRLAAVGRSLGIHLVLATQRPGGVVTTDIRANVGLRIALRVRDRADSTDVVDSPAAALLSAAAPGRAVLRGSSTSLTEFQTALVSGVTPPRAVGVRVTPVEPAWLRSVARSLGADVPAGPTDLHRIVEATRSAAASLAVGPASSPWLPPLPDLVTASSLVCGPSCVPVGLADDPAGQAQVPWVWDLDLGGHLGIAGGPGSGRTTAVLSIAASLGRLFPLSDVHLYAIGPPALSALESLPHVAGVAAIDDASDVALVLGALRAALAARLAGRCVVLFVDGWEQLAALSNGSVAAEVRGLLDSGGASGLRAVVAGGRAVLAGQLTSMLSERLVLRVSDPVVLTLAGIPVSAVPARQPPGRALDLRTKLEVQIGVAPVPAMATSWESRIAAGSPARVRRLPSSIRLGELEPSPGLLPVGVREGDLATVGFRLDRGERRAVVVGPPGSGRTTALATLGHGLREVGLPVSVVGTSLAALLPWATAFDASDRDALIAARREQANLAVLVDDVERVDGQPVDAVIREITRLVDGSGGFVAVSATAHTLETRASALAAELARTHTGIALWPSTGMVLGTRPTPLQRLPGRGALIVSAVAHNVQVAWS